MHAIVTPILKMAHNYRQDGREMTFCITHLGGSDATMGSTVDRSASKQYTMVH